MQINKMNKKLANYKFLCGFCGEKKPFKTLQQVPLRIDKYSRSQYLFEFYCDECMENRVKSTKNNQSIRLFTGRSRNINEKTVFDDKEDHNNIM